jgi:hypothetical protein
MSVPTVYLTKRNLLTLLSKLERAERGEATRCTLNKNQQPSDKYRQTMKTIDVVAVADDEYYSAQQRAPGEVHPLDEPK